MYDAVQRCSRTRMVLPLRVWLEDLSAEAPTYLAHTIDTSEIGCRLGGLRTELHPGQIITLQRGQHKAPFRVIWSRQLELHENHAGLEAVDHSVNIWSVNPQANQPETERMNASPRAASSTSVSHKVASGSGKPEPGQKSVLTRARQRLSWCLGVSFVLLTMAMALYLAFQVFPSSAQAAIEPHVPAPPTAEDLARLTPKPHPMPASLTKPLDPSASRLEVAEAPTGHIVYPAPDDLITGKVRLQIVIAANGLVKQIHVLSGKQPLAEAAAGAVRLWHYASFSGTGPDNERQTSVTVSFLSTDAVSLEFPHARSSVPSSQDN
jgi:Gram-negative bacterial TonB protein C-terminal